MSIQARIIAALIACMLTAVATWKVQDWRYAAKDDEKQKQIVALQQQLDKAHAELDAQAAAALSADMENAKANETAVETDSAKHPTGYNIPVPAAGMSEFRRAVAATAATR